MCSKKFYDGINVIGLIANEVLYLQIKIATITKQALMQCSHVAQLLANAISVGPNSQRVQIPSNTIPVYHKSHRSRFRCYPICVQWGDLPLFVLRRIGWDRHAVFDRNQGISVQN